jgi:hypothetical protein
MRLGLQTRSGRSHLPTNPLAPPGPPSLTHERERNPTVRLALSAAIPVTGICAWFQRRQTARMAYVRRLLCEGDMKIDCERLFSGDVYAPARRSPR